MLKYLTTFATTLFLGSAVSATDLMPDRVFVNLATKHYGLGERVFGTEGPNEINPGVGLAWENMGPNLTFSSGFYKDSFSQLAYTGGVSYPIIDREKLNFSVGMSFTASFGGEKTITVPKKYKPSEYKTAIVKRRVYTWPYLNLSYRNFYVQWRPGINKEKEPAGVFSFGLTFRLTNFNNR